MHSSKSSLKNSKGIATLLGLFMLFTATITGIALIYISQKDKLASIDSFGIRNIAFAADASLEACENEMKFQPDTMVAILNKYIKNHSYKWLLAPSTSAALIENRASIGNSGINYSAQISAFDTSNMILQIQGFVYGTNNEQKSITGVYKITGLKKALNQAEYALYLAGGGRNFDSKINVTGNVYVGTDFNFNGNASNSVVHGSLKTGMNTSLTSWINGSVTFDSAVYIGTGLALNSALLCKSKFGIEGLLTLNNVFTIQSDAWFNNINGGNQNTNMSGKTIHHSGLVNMARIVNGAEDNRGALISNIAGQIGLETDDTPWSVDTSIFSPLAIPVVNIDAASLQTMYDTCSNNRKINGYMVVTDQWGPINLNYNPTVFKGKVIWLLHSGMHINGQWFFMDPSSRMLVYADRYAQLNGFGGPNGMKFNGYIFLNDNAGIMLGGSGINYYYGAIHLVGKNTHWQLNSGVEEFLAYDKTILSEFISMGIIKTGNGTSGNAGTFVLSDFKIRAQLLGMVF